MFLKLTQLAATKKRLIRHRKTRFKTLINFNQDDKD
jgi:hypothetical protein